MGEAFAALVALVRLLPGVEPHVFDQVVFVFEGLGADAALVRSLPCREEENKYASTYFRNIKMLLSKKAQTWEENNKHAIALNPPHCAKA